MRQADSEEAADQELQCGIQVECGQPDGRGEEPHRIGKRVGYSAKVSLPVAASVRGRGQGGAGAAPRAAPRKQVRERKSTRSECSRAADRGIRTSAGPQAAGGGFFKTSLRASQGSSAESYQQWRQGVYRGIKTPLSFEGVALTVEQQCRLAEVSRAGFYRHLQQTAPKEADLLLRARLQELAVAHHRLRGYRMLTALLRREGQQVNHKRVLRLMREDNLLSLRRRKYVFTTDSTHALPIYPNLARRVRLTGLNQLWVADITFIRLRNEFVYLAVVLDAYSRRVIGWDLDRTLEAELAIRALQMALRRRDWKAEELVHHSDRGVQYASADYTDILDQGEIQISMSRRGNPYDNARAERFMRTLKQEEVYGTDYRDLKDARSRIGQFLDQVYNRQRLHSALRYLTPEEFERNSQARESDGADGNGGKPKSGLPPLPQALEIPTGLPHSRGTAAANQ